MGKMSIMVQRNGANGGRFYPVINLVKFVSSSSSSSNHDSIDEAVTATTTTCHFESTAKVAEGNVICRICPTMMAPHDKDLPGPSPNSSLCLGCCKWFETDRWKCAACNWPLCSEACQSGTLHAQYECRIFRKYPVNPTSFRGVYDAILAYRAISLFMENKKLLEFFECWAALPIKNQPTLSHTMGKSVEEEIQNFLIQTCGLKTKKIFNTNEKIGQLLHFIACNSLCQDTPASAYDIGGTRNYHSAKYLFPSNHAFGQSCCPNISHTINFGGTHLNESYLLLWTTQQLDVGDKIFGDFHQPCVKLGTVERRQVHRKLGYPICHCDRCKDPTELGSYASAVCCPVCKQDYLLPADPLEDESKWKCYNNKCNYLIVAKEIYKKLQIISCDIDDTKNDLSGLIRLMKSLQTTLHPCHYLYCRAADYIVDLGWNIVKSGTITSFALNNFEPFIQAAQMKCSAFAKFISKGHTIHRAKYIYFWQMIEGIRLTQRAVYCNQNYLYDDGQTIAQKLEQIRRYQKYVIKILSWQNVGSPERSLLELLIKCESELAELLRTSLTTDILKAENIEILKKAFSYFCNKVYELPPPLNVECISLPTVELGEYSKFFGY